MEKLLYWGVPIDKKSVVDMIDVAEIDKIRYRIQAAHDEAGSDPWLYGYDVVGIQDFIVARNRPIAMRGASETVLSFDSDSGMNIFCGGGRGIGLASSRENAESRCRELTKCYRDAGGVLATAAVPYTRDQANACLTWLRSKLELAKDESDPPPSALPSDKLSQCSNCFRHPATTQVQHAERSDAVCSLCAASITRGRRTKEVSESLTALSPSKIVAAVSADGNGLGRFFESVGTLEQLAITSKVIAAIFADAHQVAMKRLKHCAVPLVTGGDDIRVFLAVEDLLSYVETLVRQVESLADKAGSVHGTLDDKSASLLARLGVGVGAVVMHGHFPAARLLDYAHLLEDSAKSICRAGTELEQRTARSAFDLEVLTSSDAFTEGVPMRSPSDGRPFKMDRDSWQDVRKRAAALRAVPSSQLAILAEARSLSEPEFLNMFRYQVARSLEWQRYYRDCGFEWTDINQLDLHRPSLSQLALLRVLERDL